jgi:hypothetical protein
MRNLPSRTWRYGDMLVMLLASLLCESLGAIPSIFAPYLPKCTYAF